MPLWAGKRCAGTEKRRTKEVKDTESISTSLRKQTKPFSYHHRTKSLSRPQYSNCRRLQNLHPLAQPAHWLQKNRDRCHDVASHTTAKIFNQKTLTPGSALPLRHDAPFHGTTQSGKVTSHSARTPQSACTTHNHDTSPKYSNHLAIPPSAQTVCPTGMTHC